jgi:DNA-binding GntR family transcriptional regulator
MRGVGWRVTLLAMGIRAALQRDKGVSLAYTSIRQALGQLEARKAVEQDGDGGWRVALEAAS